jgi:hypothetical protein
MTHNVSETVRMRHAASAGKFDGIVSVALQYDALKRLPFDIYLPTRSAMDVTTEEDEFFTAPGGLDQEEKLNWIA